MAGSPADGQSPAVQAAFARLRDGFVAGLPQRWQAIEAAGSGPDLEATLHRLVGAAASYGLVAMGEAARRAEALAREQAAPALHWQAVAPAGAPGGAPAGTPTGTLADALVELRRLIDEAVTVR